MGNPSNHAGSEVEVIEGPGVHIEVQALDQLRRVAGLPGCVRAVGMPDLHPGPGIPIGMVTASTSHIHPTLVGSDAGCGVTAVVARKTVAAGKWLRRIERATSDPDPLPVDPLEALQAVWHHGPRGLAMLDGLDEELQEWVATVPWGEPLGPSGPIPKELREARFGEALGTTGGGNHFVELARVKQVFEDDALPELRRGAMVVLAHSGSRGLGYALVKRWQERALHESEEISTYLGELAGCCRFAQANRALLVWRMLEAVGAGRVDRLGGSLDLVHNDVRPGDSPDVPWVHRKGAAPARAGELTITLGSRGNESWILRGQGNEAHLSSVAHGAGRKIPRTEAKARLSHRYRRTDLRRTPHGGQVLCDRPELLWEEHQDVYKPIEPVVAALEGAAMGHPRGLPPAHGHGEAMNAMNQPSRVDHVLRIGAGRGPLEARRFVGMLAEALCTELAGRGVAITDIERHGDRQAPSRIALWMRGDDAQRVAHLLGTHLLLGERRGSIA